MTKLKDFYIHINEVDSEYTRMGMPYRFGGDCVRRYVRHQEVLPDARKYSYHMQLY